MSALRPPSLGPIVGHTTASTCRIWIRAGDPSDDSEQLAEDRRTIGVITVLDDDGQAVPGDPSRTHYFRLHREFDRTGTFNLGEDEGLGGENGGPFTLQPDRQYRVRMGTLALDDPRANDESVSDSFLTSRLPPATAWIDELAAFGESSGASFRTFPGVEGSNLNFLFGSCRYPGLLWKRKHSDAIFKPMLKRSLTDGAGRPRFVMMVGDQIYADMFNRAIPIGLADTYREFQDRYHDAFGSKNMRALLRQAPVYMILDDHEIEDNWTQDRIERRQSRTLFNLAIGAYMSYQWIHGPRTESGRLFYEFECGGFPFFVLDVRTQRYKDDVDGIEDNHLLGRPSFDPIKEPSQLDKLCNWLTMRQKHGGDRPKFIVSPSVFVPNGIATAGNLKRQEQSDSWQAFPTTRRALLKHIVEEQIQNVVFLSGDIHCSNVAGMRFSGAASSLKAFSITSSALYWPFFFADGDSANYVHESAEQSDTFDVGDGIQMDYRAYNFTQEDNFCQVTVDWDQKRIGIDVIGKDGDVLVRSELGLA